MKMAKAKAWEVTDEFWSCVERLIPLRQRVADQTYTRKSGGGRKPKDPRRVFEGIAWRWQSIDGAMMKAPLAQESVGPNPTDRGRKWAQASFAGGRSWRPLNPSLDVVARRDRGQPA